MDRFCLTRSCVTPNQPTWCYAGIIVDLPRACDSCTVADYSVGEGLATRLVILLTVRFDSPPSKREIRFGENTSKGTSISKVLDTVPLGPPKGIRTACVNRSRPLSRFSDERVHQRTRLSPVSTIDRLVGRSTRPKFKNQNRAGS